MLKYTWLGAICLVGCVHDNREFPKPFQEQIVGQEASNTSRYISVIERNEPPGKDDGLSRRVHYCLEEVGPAALLSNLSVSLPIKTGSVEVTPGVQYSTQIGKIYDVPMLAQLTATTLYRLCEARANGDITTNEYFELLNQLVAVQVTLASTQAPGGVGPAEDAGTPSGGKATLSGKMEMAAPGPSAALSPTGRSVEGFFNLQQQLLRQRGRVDAGP